MSLPTFILGCMGYVRWFAVISVYNLVITGRTDFGMSSRNTPTIQMLPRLAHSVRGWMEMQKNPTVPGTKNMWMAEKQGLRCIEP